MRPIGDGATEPVERNSFAPSSLLPRPILERFGQMGGLDVFLAREISDGARDLEHAVEGAGAEVHLGHGAAHEAAAGLV